MENTDIKELSQKCKSNIVKSANEVKIKKKDNLD